MAPKIVLTRFLDQDKLEGAAILAKAAKEGKIELTVYDKPGNAPREWVLENVKGSQGVVVMLGDKVIPLIEPCRLRRSWLIGLVDGVETDQ